MTAKATMKNLTARFLGGVLPSPEDRLGHIAKLKSELQTQMDYLPTIEAQYKELEELLSNGAPLEEVEAKEKRIAEASTRLVRLRKLVEIAEKQNAEAANSERAAKENERQAKARASVRTLRDELLKFHHQAVNLVSTLSKVKELSEHLDEENAFFRAANRKDLLLAHPLNLLGAHIGPLNLGSGKNSQVAPYILDPVREFRLRDYWPNWPDRTEYQYLGRIGEIEV